MVYLEQADEDDTKKKKKKKKAYIGLSTRNETGLGLARNHRPASCRAKEGDKPCKPSEVKGIESSPVVSLSSKWGYVRLLSYHNHLSPRRR